AAGDRKFAAAFNSALPEAGSDFILTDTIIKISALLDPQADIKGTKEMIKTMAAEIDIRLDNEGNPQKVVDIINRYFFSELMYRFDPAWNPVMSGERDATEDELANFHSIRRVIERKQGICLTISLIYLMIAEELKLPMYGVLIPGHIYVRYRQEGRGGINIETTMAGGEFYGYMNPAYTGTAGKRSSIYGKELSKQELLGAYLLNLGSFFLFTGRASRAEIMLERASAYMPSAAEPFLNLALLYETGGKSAKAVEYYNKALELSGNGGFPLSRIGLIYLGEKRYFLARDYLERAVASGNKESEVLEALELAKKRGG
ncbi:MAG TPA: hypothetical protein ENN43_02405, partial [bacterium]|nr:hypothetical protein [bacterium]